MLPCFQQRCSRRVSARRAHARGRDNASKDSGQAIEQVAQPMRSLQFCTAATSNAGSAETLWPDLLGHPRARISNTGRKGYYRQGSMSDFGIYLPSRGAPGRYAPGCGWPAGDRPAPRPPCRCCGPGCPPASPPLCLCSPPGLRAQHGGAHLVMCGSSSGQGHGHGQAQAQAHAEMSGCRNKTPGVTPARSVPQE